MMMVAVAPMGPVEHRCNSYLFIGSTELHMGTEELRTQARLLFMEKQVSLFDHLTDTEAVSWQSLLSFQTVTNQLQTEAKLHAELLELRDRHVADFTTTRITIERLETDNKQLHVVVERLTQENVEFKAEIARNDAKWAQEKKNTANMILFSDIGL